MVFFICIFHILQKQTFTHRDKISRLIDRIARKNLGEVISNLDCCPSDKIHLYDCQKKFVCCLEQLKITK